MAMTRAPRGSSTSSSAPLENDLQGPGGTTLSYGSQSQSCGNTAPGPPQTIPEGAASTWRVYCAVGFWGSVTYAIIYQGTHNGDLELSYSTFDGTYTCTVTNSELVFNCPSGDLFPENSNATGENWHYLFSTNAG
jgi:hypothetical protein